LEPPEKLGLETMPKWLPGMAGGSQAILVVYSLMEDEGVYTIKLLSLILHQKCSVTVNE
jgi:hypothetical protein